MFNYFDYEPEDSGKEEIEKSANAARIRAEHEARLRFESGEEISLEGNKAYNRVMENNGVQPTYVTKKEPFQLGASLPIEPKRIQDIYSQALSKTRLDISQPAHNFLDRVNETFDELLRDNDIEKDWTD